MGGPRVSRWLTATAVSVMIAVGAASVTACGGDSGDEKKRPGPDLTALRCPMVQTASAGGVERYEPAKDAFDTAALVGMKLADAREKAAGHGCEIVVASVDGRGQAVPIEVDPTRVYVFVERDVVTYIEGVGGGI
jgi:hypothetical protein